MGKYRTGTKFDHLKSQIVKLQAEVEDLRGKNMRELANLVDEESLRKTEAFRTEFKNLETDLQTIIDMSQRRIELDPLDNNGRSFAETILAKAKAAKLRANTALQEV